MEATKKQSLRFAENLELPTVQVIVISANTGCSHCRRRVSQIASKMNGLLDCLVDLRKNEVVLRGTFDVKKGKASKVKIKRQTRNRLPLPRVLGYFRMLFGFSTH